MPKVLIFTGEDLQQRLRRTILWRPEIERLFAYDGPAVLACLRDRRPVLLVVDGRWPDTADLVRQIRADADLRGVSIAALLDDADDAELVLRTAGANVVLSEGISEPLWDDAMQELVNVPPRRAVTFSVSLAIGARPGAKDERIDVSALNVSIRGLLVETPRPLPPGTVVNIFFSLPGDADTLHLVGRVVWERPAGGGLSRQGVEFLGFHGDALGRIGDFVARG